MDNFALGVERGLGRRGPCVSRKGAAVFLALSLVLPGPAARAAEFEISASSFTTDGQVNMSSVTYYGGMMTPPANPSVTQLLNTPGGLYFDGTRYRVWDNPASAWVSLTTGTAGGLLPWSELTSYPGVCSGNTVVTGVGPALICATPSGTLSGGTAGYYGKWIGGAAMGIGNLVDNGTSVTMIANSTLTVSGNAFSVGSSTLVVTGGNIGVGTASPGAKLVVNGFGGPSGAMSSTLQTNAGALGTTAGSELALGSIGGTTSNNSALGIRLEREVAGTDWTTSGIQLSYDVDNTTRAGAFIELSRLGNVGIGTASPSSKLSVNTANAVDGIGIVGASNQNLSLYTNNGAGSSNPLTQTGDRTIIYSGAAIDAPGGGLVIAPWASAAKGVRLDQNGNVGIGTTGPVGMFQVGAGTMTVLSSGNVGIGTVSPGAKLTIGGTLGGTAMSATLQSSAGALGTTAGNELVLGSIGGTTSNVSALGIRLEREASGTDWMTTGLQLAYDVDSTPRAGAFIELSHSGNVGIGTTSPAAKLHISSGSLLVDGNASTAFQVGVSSFIINSSGNVGIGTTSPGAKLDVAGNQIFSVANASITFNAGGPTIGIPAGNTLAFGTSGIERMRIDNLGNVGIGTTTSAARLQVAGAIQAQNIALGITPTTTGTWGTLPGSLGNATDGSTTTVTTAGQTTQTAIGLSNINIDLGAVHRGIIYFLGGAWASGGATSTTVLSYSQDSAFNSSQWNSWTNTCTTECPVYFAMPFYGRYIAVSCYTSNAANPDNCVIYDLTAALYQ